MKLALSTVVLAGALAPAVSLSYLDSLSQGANPVMSKPAGGSGMNGASYLDALSSPAPTSSAPSGSGISSYLDSLPSNDASSGSAWGVSPTPEPEPVAASSPPPASSYELPSWGASASTDLSGSGIKGYLDGLVSSASSAPTGAGIRGYLDALPQGPAPTGYGMRGYLDALPQGPAPTGSGMRGYLDAIAPSGSGGFSSYAPSSSSPVPASASFSSYTTSGSDVGFTLEADNLSDLVKQMGSAGTIRLSGTVENVSFN